MAQKGVAQLTNTLTGTTEVCVRHTVCEARLGKGRCVCEACGPPLRELITVLMMIAGANIAAPPPSESRPQARSQAI